VVRISEILTGGASPTKAAKGRPERKPKTLAAEGEAAADGEAAPKKAKAAARKPAAKKPAAKAK
jgi:large subunit ribosomal protein L21